MVKGALWERSDSHAKSSACTRTPASLHTHAYELAYARLRLAGKEMLRILSHPLALRGVLRQAPAPAKGKKKPTAQGGGLFLCDALSKSIHTASFFEIDPCFSVGG